MPDRNLPDVPVDTVARDRALLADTFDAAPADVRLEVVKLLWPGLYMPQPRVPDPEGLDIEPDPADVEWFAQARARSVRGLDAPARHDTEWEDFDPEALLFLRSLSSARRKYGPDMTLSDAYHSERESIGTPVITLREALRIYGDGCTLAEAMIYAKAHGWDVDDWGVLGSRCEPDPPRPT